MLSPNARMLPVTDTVKVLALALGRLGLKGTGGLGREEVRVSRN